MLAELMLVFSITFAVFLLFFLFMGIGYMVKKEPLRGSCGRVANMMGDEVCSICGDDPNKCDSITDRVDDDYRTSNNKSSSIAEKAKQLGKPV